MQNLKSNSQLRQDFAGRVKLKILAIILIIVLPVIWIISSTKYNNDQAKFESNKITENIIIDNNIDSSIEKDNSPTTTETTVVKEKQAAQPIDQTKEKRNESLANNVKDDQILKPKESEKEKLTEYLDNKNIPYQEKSDLVVVTDDYEKVSKKVENSNWLEFSEPEGIVKALLTPNDTSYSSQSTYLSQISLQSGWDFGQGSRNILIAVIDTGIKGTHEDLSDRVTSGRNIITSSDISSGVDSDDNGHGTIIAGIIGANGNNSKGIAGVDWNATLMPVKTLNSSGEGTTSDLATGINWAVTNGAKVINISAGTYTDSQAVQSAVDNAWNNNRIVVAASGNDGSRTTIMYPAKYENAIAVGSINSSNSISSFSNATSEIDVVAPGESIVSISDTSTTSYTTASGTSVSAPLVAGNIGLMFALDSSLSSSQIKSIIKDNATSLGDNNLYGSGKINAYNTSIRSLSSSAYAYSWVTAGPQTGPGSARDPITPGQSAQLYVTLRNTGTQTWSNTGSNPVHLGMSSPKDRGSSFTSGQNVRMSMDESSVAPGSTGTFRLNITAPYQPGDYWEHFDMVIEGIRWVGGDLPWFMKVGNPLSASYVNGSQGPHVADSIIRLSPGESTTLTVQFTNTSGANWYNTGGAPIYLGSANPKDRGSAFTGGENRRALMVEGGIANGGIATFNLSITAPAQTGTYKEYYDLVVDNVGWIYTGLYWDIVVE